MTNIKVQTDKTPNLQLETTRKNLKTTAKIKIFTLNISYINYKQSKTDTSDNI